MATEGYSLADIRAATGGDDRNGYDGQGNFLWWVLILFFLARGNGFGWGNEGMQGALTRADLCQDMNFNQLENAVRGVQQGLCDGFYAMNTTMLQGFHGIDNAICTVGYQSAQLANGINANITEARFDAKSCCCETNRNIDAVRYENARNTCDIVNAIKEDGAATRALMTQNTIQDLRDRLQTAEAHISNTNQTQQLVNELRPCARPAYITCSPYQSLPYGYGYNNNGYAYNNNCNNCNSCGF